MLDGIGTNVTWRKEIKIKIKGAQTPKPSIYSWSCSWVISKIPKCLNKKYIPIIIPIITMQEIVP